MSSFSFKDNLTIDNGKYLKWLNSTGTTRINIIALDSSNQVNLNCNGGSMYLNSSSGTTFLNAYNTNGNVLVNSKLGIGMLTTDNINGNITLIANGYMTVNNNSGYLGLSGGINLDNIAGSRIILHGNSSGNSGQMELFGGNVSDGNIKFYTGNDTLRVQILNSTGSTIFTPNGSTPRVSISDTQTLLSNQLIINNTIESHSSSSGAIIISGGIGVKGNLYVDGTIGLSTGEGNINFDSSQASTSSTTGSIFISGGIGVATTTNAVSITSGGGITNAGGMAIGKDTYIGGILTINNTSEPTSSVDGALVLYGGAGLNGPIYLRSNSQPQIKIAPQTNGTQTGIMLHSLNTFNTFGSWGLSNNNGVFKIENGDNYSVFEIDSFNNITLFNTTNAIGIGSGGNLTILGGTSVTQDVYIGGQLNIDGGILGGNTSNSSFAYLTLTATDDALNLSTGALVTFGGITIQSSSDSIGLGTGGALLVNGGASINGSLFLKGPILQVPCGNTIDQPIGTIGYLRFNTDTNQFEGFAAGYWSGLGGVINVDQSTKILAELSAGSTDGNLRFITNNLERMRINSSGNIGIGTSSPSKLVDINGSINVTTSITSGALYATNITVINLMASNNSLSNIISTNISTSTINLSTGLTTSSILNTGLISTSSLTVLNSTLSNTLSTNITSGTINLIIGLTSASILNTGLISTSSLIAMTSTLPNAIITNISSGTIDLSIGLTSANINVTGLISTANLTALTSTLPNAIFTNITSGTINISTGITSNSILNTGLISTSSLTSLTSTLPNAIFTNITSGIINVSTGITSASINITGLISTSSLTALISTLPNIISTNITTATINISTGNITILNTDLISTANLISTTSTLSNAIFTNISSGTINLSIGLTTGTILNTGLISTTNLIASTSTLQNTIFTNISTGTINIDQTLKINSTTNSIGIGSGGSFTCIGGGSFNGDIYVGGSITSSSDIRLKNNIREFKQKGESFLDKIDSLRTVKFNYKRDITIEHVGFIAQDFEKEFPELLRRSNYTDYYTLDYQKISCILLECIKELKEQVNELGKKIN